MTSATLVYNDGEVQGDEVYDLLGIPPGVYAEYARQKMDQRHIMKSINCLA